MFRAGTTSERQNHIYSYKLFAQNTVCYERILICGETNQNECHINLRLLYPHD